LTGHTGAALVGAIKLALAETALDIASRRNGKVNSTSLRMIPTEARVIGLLLHFHHRAACSHGLSPLLTQTGAIPGREERLCSFDCEYEKPRGAFAPGASLPSLTAVQLCTARSNCCDSLNLLASAMPTPYRFCEKKYKACNNSMLGEVFVFLYNKKSGRVPPVEVTLPKPLAITSLERA
jgi:hypothetical protein